MFANTRCEKLEKHSKLFEKPCSLELSNSQPKFRDFQTTLFLFGNLRVSWKVKHIVQKTDLPAKDGELCLLPRS